MRLLSFPGGKKRKSEKEIKWAILLKILMINHSFCVLDSIDQMNSARRVRNRLESTLRGEPSAAGGYEEDPATYLLEA